MEEEKQCAICGDTRNIQKHHVFGNHANRKISERMGFVEYLCLPHHTGGGGVHLNRFLDLELKQKHQRIFQETHSEKEFLSLIGRNYLD